MSAATRKFRDVPPAVTAVLEAAAHLYAAFSVDKYGRKRRPEIAIHWPTSEIVAWAESHPTAKVWRNEGHYGIDVDVNGVTVAVYPKLDQEAA